MTCPNCPTRQCAKVEPLRARDFSVSPVAFRIARAFIVDHHYARGAANTACESHGLFQSGVLVGAALWMPPTRVCAESVAGDDWKTCLSLSRLAVAPGIPKNAASFLVGRSIRLIRSGRRWTHLVTFADQSQGHTGAIYRATNWRYEGVTKPSPRWVDANGRQVSRKATKTRTGPEMEALGCRVAGRFAKHKFTMVLR